MQEKPGIHLWKGVMIFALGSATFAFSQCLDLFTGLYLIAFMLVFLRFFFGQNKHLIVDHQGDPEGFYLIRNLLLFLQPMVFCLLAQTINRPQEFLLTYITLLVMNVFWLYLSNLNFRNLAHGTMNPQPYIQSLNYWSLNNVLTVFFLIAMMLSDWKDKTSFGLALVILNSYIDFMTTKKFYLMKKH